MTVSQWTMSHKSKNYGGMSSNEKSLQRLGKNIKDRRKECGFTQERLAELCDFDPTYISLLERGKRNPPLTTLITIAQHLDCQVSELTVI